LPIPEPLWAAAAKLALEHGIFPTAKALHLEYGKLKQREEATGLVAKAPQRLWHRFVIGGGTNGNLPPEKGKKHMRNLNDDEFQTVVQALREAGFSDGIDMAVSFVKGIEIPHKVHDVATEALRKYRELHPRRIT
jgi:hypothetical protein